MTNDVYGHSGERYAIIPLIYAPRYSRLSFITRNRICFCTHLVETRSMFSKFPKELKVLLVVYSGSSALSELLHITLNDIPKDLLFSFFMNRNNWCPVVAFQDAIPYEGITIQLLHQLDSYLGLKLEYHDQHHLPLECLCAHQLAYIENNEKNVKIYYKFPIPQWSVFKPNAEEWISNFIARGCVTFPVTIQEAIKTGNVTIVQALLKKLVIHPHNNLLFEACIEYKQPEILGFFIDHFNANSSIIQYCIELCIKKQEECPDKAFEDMLIMLNVAGLTPIDSKTIQFD